MVFIVVAMLVILVACGALAAFVAYPNRGREVPGLPWVGEAMNRAAERMPVLDETSADPVVETTTRPSSEPDAEPDAERVTGTAA